MLPSGLRDGVPILRRLCSARVAAVLCALLSLGTNVTAKSANKTVSTCVTGPTIFSILCPTNNQRLTILGAAAYSACLDDSTSCGPAVDSLVTKHLADQCYTGASECKASMSQTPPEVGTCDIKYLKINFTCDDAPLPTVIVGTTVQPDEWWKDYGSTNFIVIWCVVGCVVIISIIAALLVACGCCPKCCHSYGQPNTLSKLALMTLSSIDRTTMAEYKADSSFSLTREPNGQQSDYCSVSSGGGAGTPEGGSVVAAARLGGQLSGSQATLDRGSALSGRYGGGSTLEFGPTRGGRVTASQGASDKMSTLSRQSENGGTAASRASSTLSRGNDSSANLAKQNSSQDSGIGIGPDELETSGIEFGTKKRSKQDPQPVYFGQKGLACPADVTVNASTLKRPGNTSSAGDGGRPRGLFQKNTAGVGVKDGQRGDLSSPSDPRSFDPAGGVYAATARRGSSFSALTDPDPAAMAAQRSATLSRLHSRSKSAMALMGVDDSLHALRTSTLTREKTKTQESNRTVTMSLEEALAAGRINAAANPTWSGVVATATLPRPRHSATAKEAGDADGAPADGGPAASTPEAAS